MTVFDRIEKRVTLRAPRARVWGALVDAEQFGRWFGVKLVGSFVVGETVTGVFDGSLDESAIVAYQKQLGLTPSKVKMPEPEAVFCTVESIEPERYFAFRWIPYGIDARPIRRTSRRRWSSSASRRSPRGHCSRSSSRDSIAFLRTAASGRSA